MDRVLRDHVLLGPPENKIPRRTGTKAQSNLGMTCYVISEAVTLTEMEGSKLLTCGCANMCIE